MQHSDKNFGAAIKFSRFFLFQFLFCYDFSLYFVMISITQKSRDSSAVKFKIDILSHLICNILEPYTQYPIIRNGLIGNSAQFLGKFKKRALGRSNLRNASKNVRNGQCSDFQS